MIDTSFVGSKHRENVADLQALIESGVLQLLFTPSLTKGRCYFCAEPFDNDRKAYRLQTVNGARPTFPMSTYFVHYPCFESAQDPSSDVPILHLSLEQPVSAA